MNGKNITLKIIISICVTVMAAAVIYFSSPEKTVCYIASDRPDVTSFVPDDKGGLKESDPIARGTEVTKVSSSFEGYDCIELDGEKYYVDPSAISETPEDIVLEKKMFVRTPVTLYENKTGPDIAGFAPKESELEVIGHTRLLPDGSVKKYKVRLDDVTGWVYSKYLVFDKESAAENCNEKGIYDMAKKARYPMELYGGKAANLDYYPCEKVKIKGNDFCDNARAMYLHAGAAVSDKYFDLAKESGANAVVINIDGGTLAYKSPVAKELCPSAYKDAHYSLEKYKKSVRKYNDEGFYTIGRIVAFNDPHYASDHKDACIRSGGKSTKWVSAYDRNAWEYKVKLAIEAIDEMGFNEIQFDYVRFPESAYEMSASGNTDFRNRYHEDKAQAIQNFCFYAADQIHDAGAYISIDVFGEASSGYVTAYGQYWPAISNVVDAISAMPYMDHFGGPGNWEDPYKGLKGWAKKSAAMQKKTPTPASARTWITGYNTPYWAPAVDYDYKKLHDQVRALEDAGLDGGFIPWNSECDYSKYKEYKKIWKK